MQHKYTCIWQDHGPSPSRQKQTVSTRCIKHCSFRSNEYLQLCLHWHRLAQPVHSRGDGLSSPSFRSRFICTPAAFLTPETARRIVNNEGTTISTKQARSELHACSSLLIW